mgnify:CR=1 FL=1
MTTAVSSPPVCPKCRTQECWLLVEEDKFGEWKRCIMCSFDIESKPQEQPKPKGRPHGRAWRGG